MKALPWINAGAFAATVTVNALANLLPIGGSTTGEISEAYPNLFTPAPVTFSIWGLIYLMMLLFVIFQFGILDHGAQSIGIRERVGVWFAVSCMLNIAWILLWHFRLIGLSLICIALLLIVLKVILNRLDGLEAGWLGQFTANTGFSVYYGWIMAATIANACVFLTKAGWNGWGLSEDFWTVAVLLIGAVIAAAVALIDQNRIAAITMMWAYAGILLRHLTMVDRIHYFVIGACIVSEAMILIAVLAPKLIRNSEQQTERH